MQKESSVFRACARLTVLMIHILYALLLIVKYRAHHGREWFDTEPGKLIIRWWTQRACRILAVRLHVKGTASIVQDTLFVANHISWLDIIALSAVMNTKFISKDTVRYWPVIGWLAAAIGTLFIHRGKSFAVNRMIEDVRLELDNNHSILVFPEGTTTDGRQVARFHAGLFKSVSGSSHFVQAIALRYRRQGGVDKFAPYIGNDNFAGHLFRIASLRETCLEVAFSQPFQTANMSRYDIAMAAHDVIVDMLRGHQDITPQRERLVA